MKLLSIDLNNISDSTLYFLVRYKDTNPLILDGIARTYSKTEILKLIIKNPSTSAETITYLRQYSTDEIKGYISGKKAIIPFDRGLKLTEEDEEIFLKEDEEKRIIKGREVNLSFRIQRMNVSEKIQLALRGNKEVRSILIRDSNKEVFLSVMDNPKITETEIELIAQSRNVSEEVLRTVSKNREWTRNYSIVYSLVNNPKTPVGISLSLLNTLKSKDLQFIGKSKGVSSVLMMAAKRLLSQRSPKG